MEERWLNLGLLPKNLRSQACIKTRSQRAELSNYLKAKEASGSPTCMNPSQGLGELKPCVHFLFLKESIPKLYLSKPHGIWPPPCQMARDLEPLLWLVEDTG